MWSLIAKTIGGFVFLMVVLLVVIFSTAGSSNFWQAWIYLSVFAVCTIAITIYLARYDPKLLASRVKGGPTAERRHTQQAVQSLASIFFLGLYVMSGLDFRFHWSAVPPIVSIIADGFVAVGFFIIFLVFKENRYTSATIEIMPQQTVITTGPYHVVRHPMYSGAIVMLASTPLALGSWAALACLIPMVCVIVVRLLDEERFLAEHLPGYAAYCRQVRYRLVPNVW